MDATAETRAWQTLCERPFQRRRSVELLHRFIGTHSGRKEQYAGMACWRTSDGVRSSADALTCSWEGPHVDDSHLSAR
jgi:hypothetical protein